MTQSLSVRAAQVGARTPFVMVGGVPGAGKSTALATAASLLPQWRLLDSETERRHVDAFAPGVPYAVLRPLVHLRHQVRVAWALLRGPAECAGLVVHDPSTRWLRLGLLGRVARARGWEPLLLFVDASHSQALGGQADRGRVVTRRTFRRHWARWRVLRGLLTEQASRMPARWAFALAPWPIIRLVPRPEAAAALGELAGTRLAARPAARDLAPGRLSERETFDLAG